MPAKRELQLLQGTLDLMVLKALEGGAQHGYGVARWVRESTDETLNVEEGALYTSLHRLELRGWVAGSWGTSENNRKAKYYELTRAGRRQLAAEAKSWTRYAAAMLKLLGEAPAGARSR
jgi:transcriptional regulator